MKMVNTSQQQTRSKRMICARSRPETKLFQMKIVSKETHIDKAKNVWKNLCCGACLYLGSANGIRTTFAVLVWR